MGRQVCFVVGERVWHMVSHWIQLRESLATGLQCRVYIFVAENLNIFGLCPQVVTVLASSCLDKSHSAPENVIEGDCLACLHLGSGPSDPLGNSHSCHTWASYFQRVRL